MLTFKYDGHINISLLIWQIYSWEIIFSMSKKIQSNNVNFLIDIFINKVFPYILGMHYLFLSK